MFQLAIVVEAQHAQEQQQALDCNSNTAVKALLPFTFSRWEFVPRAVLF